MSSCPSNDPCVSPPAPVLQIPEMADLPLRELVGSTKARLARNSPPLKLEMQARCSYGRNRRRCRVVSGDLAAVRGFGQSLFMCPYSSWLSRGFGQSLFVWPYSSLSRGFGRSRSCHAASGSPCSYGRTRRYCRAASGSPCSYGRIRRSCGTARTFGSVQSRDGTLLAALQQPEPPP